MNLAKALSVDDVKKIVEEKKTACIKYVRVGHEFRYAIAGGILEHRQLVEEDEVPTSAGFFTLFNDSFHLSDTPSTSLRLGPLPEDGIFLKSIFGGQYEV